MTIAMGKAKKLARRLLCENLKNGRSWRKIASEDYGNLVSYATLNRFAISKSTWIPKSKKILAALGLIQPPKTKPKRIFDLSPKELLWCLENRSEI